MNPFRVIVRRSRSLFRKDRLDAEMAEEMRTHVERQVQANLHAGMAPDEARYAALRQFGGMDQIKERCRDQRGWLWLEQLGQDLRFAARTLVKAPGFSAVAVLTLALGIGVNTAMFSVIYGVLLDPYPYAKSGEIWAPEVADAKTGRSGGFRLGDYLDLAGLPAVASSMATAFGSATLSGGDNPEIINAPQLSGSAFAFLGVPPVLGRGLTPADIRPNGEPEAVCVLSFKLWQRLFNGDRDILNRTLVLDGQPHAIVGVMPPRFGWYGDDGLWVPLAMTDVQRSVRPIVRFKPGVTREVAGQQLFSLVQAKAKLAPDRVPRDGFIARFGNYLDGTVASGEMRSSLQLFFGTVCFLLLIVCSNVASLQLARGATRSREIAVRLALGAGRGRLFRQLLTESVVLAVAGGLLGVAVAFVLTRLIVALMPDYYVPNEARVTLNAWVLGFSAGLSVLTGILFGLVPALQGTRPDLNEALKDGGHANGLGGARGGRTRNTLVVVEIALAIVLLVGATLTVRGFVELLQIDRGFRPERTLILRVPLAPARYATFTQRNAFARELLARLQALPGVAAAAVGGAPQFDGSSGGTIPGQPKIDSGIEVTLISTDYLATLGIPLHTGRNLTPGEIARGDHVALINETAARLWPAGESPLGRSIQIDALVGGGGANLPPPDATAEVTVVGIVGDIRTRDMRQAPPPAVFLPYTLRGLLFRTFLVKTTGEPTSLLHAVRTELRTLDREQPLLPPITAEELISQQTAQPRFNLVLFASVAVIALALATAGIYGVLSYSVAQRTREIGVRMALGATRGHILRLVLGTGGRLLATGTLIGIAASAGLAQIVSSQVFNVPLLDPLSITAAALLLSAATAFACWWPARRATKVDPMVALRTE